MHINKPSHTHTYKLSYNPRKCKQYHRYWVFSVTALEIRNEAIIDKRERDQRERTDNIEVSIWRRQEGKDS